MPPTSPALTRSRSACLLFSTVQAKCGSSIVSRLGETGIVDAADLSGEELRGVTGVTERVGAIFERVREDFDPSGMLRELGDRGLSVVTLADEEYPDSLREAPDPPPALYVDGDLRRHAVRIALVGSRKATRGGLSLAERLGQRLAERDVCVVSGLALGVDAAAHRGALAAGGQSVGVLGCGIDVVYPKSNRALFDEMRRCGAVVSEYYLGESPLGWRFPARNRIISGLSTVTVVVEAAEKSGALITARYANEAGRDVWAAPGPVGVAECRGSNRLLGDGATVLWDVEEFVESVAPAQPTIQSSGKHRNPQDSLPEGLPEMERRVLANVEFAARGADDIASASGVGMSALLSALTMLELKGYVGRDVGGAFFRKGVI